MIEFITLFLGGLVIGPQTVELMAADAVAIVEVRLDGALQERLDAPPWKFELDFGRELSPHLIEAVAWDASEQELARVRQWINMSPKLAQSSVIIDGADHGQGAVARVSWESLAEIGEPRLVEAYFDGQQLTIEDPHTIQLPSFDPHQTHHVRVRLEFTELFYSEAETVFGGAYGSEVNTEISAVPIWFAKGRKPKSAGSMDDWFTVGGLPQKVHALERGLAEIVVVRDVAALSQLQKLEKRVRRIDADIRLREDIRVSFINPCPVAHQTEGMRQLVFPRTQRYSSKDAPLLRLLALAAQNDCTASEQQLATATGIAGLSASEEGLRRVVLLLLGDTPQDQSELAPALVIAYLRQLRVPFVIWSVGQSASPVTQWGQATDVHKLRRLNKAFNLIEKELERQQIVWLEGLHLPQMVELRPGVEDILLVE